MPTKEYVQKRKELGLCLNCNNTVPNARFVRCDACKAKQREWCKKRTAEGRCYCGKKSEEWHKRCKECLNKANSKAKSRYATRKAAQSCVNCGKKSYNNLCRKCKSHKMSYDQEWRKGIKAEKRCFDCGEPRCSDSVRYCRECLDKRLEYSKEQNRKQRKIVLEHYGNKCICCGEDNAGFLTIDHINGGGNKHREELKNSGSTFIRWLIKNNFPPDFQLLCWNCNCGRAKNGGICPHKN